MEVAAYLDRIGVAGPCPPTEATLFALHRAHMLSVPFENLDIALGRPLGLDPERNFAKIVEQRRGGWCYELNGMFGWLLTQLGFDVRLHGAAVMLGGEPTESELVHLTLRVVSDREWLCDVGFGDAPMEPTPFAALDDGVLQWNGQAAYRVGSRERSMDEFAERCAWQQTSPESHFVQRRTCSMATPTGRITLSDLRLIETVDGIRSERELASDDEWRAVLEDRFGILLPDQAGQE